MSFFDDVADFVDYFGWERDDHGGGGFACFPPLEIGILWQGNINIDGIVHCLC